MTGQTPLNGDGMLVSGSYFPTLGIRPALGRLFSPNDDQTIGGHPIAVLSYAYWETQLGSNPNVINQQITVNGQQLTIIGVAPEGLRRHDARRAPVRLRADHDARRCSTRDSAASSAETTTGSTCSLASSRACRWSRRSTAINTVYTPIINDVEAPLQKGLSAQTLAKFKAKKLTLADGRRGQSQTQKEAKTPLFLLFSITGIVLLIACANIANLLLARAANRTMEMAVRLSLGATRRQLIAQVLTESVLLAALGGIVSIVIANWTLNGITAMLPPEATSTMDFSLSTHGASSSRACCRSAPGCCSASFRRCRARDPIS